MIFEESLLANHEGRMADVFSRIGTPVNDVVSPNDEMPSDHLGGYLGVGESALKAIRLAIAAARVPSPHRILDFACGHGRVMRWLRAAFPDAELTGADINADGVAFCSQTFSARGVQIVGEDRLVELFDDRFDLIWVGSLFTHLPSTRFNSLLALCRELLAPNGLLVMTTDGDLVAERIRSGADYGYPSTIIRAALADYERDGFGFAHDGNTGSPYGLTVSSPPWVTTALRAFDDLRLVLYTEALWANHQDVVGVVRRPLDPDVANSPYT